MEMQFRMEGALQLCKLTSSSTCVDIRLYGGRHRMSGTSCVVISDNIQPEGLPG